MSLKENKQTPRSAENCFSRALICGGAWNQRSQQRGGACMRAEVYNRAWFVYGLGFYFMFNALIWA